MKLYLYFIISIFSVLTGAKKEAPADTPPEASPEEPQENHSEHSQEHSTQSSVTEPIDHFYDYTPSTRYEWNNVVQAYEMRDMKYLKYLITVLHELSGWGSVHAFNIKMGKSHIYYKDPAYFPTDTDYLQYEIKVPENAGNETKSIYYVTEGLKEDCIFFLIPDTPELKGFYLDTHVCGINRGLKAPRNATQHPNP